MPATLTRRRTKRPPKPERVHNELLPGLEAAKKYVEANYAKSPTLPEIANAAGMSRFHFHRCYRTRYGQTTKQYASQLQITLVKDLLNGGTSLRDASAKAGFCHQSAMTLRFKQLVGQTPSRWLREQRKER